MKNMFRSFLAFACASVLLLGCQSSMTMKDQFIEVDKKVSIGDYTSAAMQLEASKDTYYSSKDRVLFYLDVGMLYHMAGNYTKSNEMLALAEGAIEELYTASISKGAASILLNDNALDYSGEAYEDVYLNAFKAVNFLKMADYDAAFVEVRRINIKLTEFENKYKKAAEDVKSSDDVKGEVKPVVSQFHNSALGRYLSLLLYRTEGNMDGAQIDFNKIKEAWSAQAQLYDFAMPDLAGHLTNSTKAKVNVLAFTGHSPQLFAKVLTIHTFPNSIAIYQSDGKEEKQLDLIPWPSVESGYHFKFSLPYMEKQKSVVARVALEVDGKECGTLKKIESLENAAVDTYKLKEGITYLKTITRTIVKGLISEKANKELDKQTGGGFFGELTRIASSALVDASENADLRLARYFPSSALVCEYELNAGTYQLGLKFYGENGTLLQYTDLGKQTVTAGKINFFNASLLQ